MAGERKISANEGVPTIFFKIRQGLSKNQTSNLAEETPRGIDV